MSAASDAERELSKAALIDTRDSLVPAHEVLEDRKRLAL